jgi:hypothetical protein
LTNAVFATEEAVGMDGNIVNVKAIARANQQQYVRSCSESTKAYLLSFWDQWTDLTLETMAEG